MHRVLNILKLRKQTSSTRSHQNSDAHATGTPLGSRKLRLRKVLGARKRGRKTANDLELEPPATEPIVLPTVNPSPAASPRLTAEAATTSLASNSTTNDPADPFRTVSTTIGTMNTLVTQVQTTQILNHSQNPNFTHSVLSNVNGNSTTSAVTNHYNYYVSGNLRVSPSELYPLREDEVPSASNAQRGNRTPSPSGIPNVADVGTPVSGGNSEDHVGVYIPLDSDGSRYVVIEARLTLPLETFELKTMTPFLFFYPANRVTTL